MKQIPYNRMSVASVVTDSIARDVKFTEGALPFVPTDIAGLELWYDSSDISTLWTDDGSTQVSSPGDLVYRMDDKSGHDGHLRQSIEVSRPTYQTTGLEFATQDWMDQTSYVPAIIPTTMFAVFKSSVSGAGQTLFSYARSGIATLYSHIGLRSTNTGIKSIRVGGVTRIAETASTYTDGNPHVIVGEEPDDGSGGDPGSLERTVWVDGSDTGTETSTISYSSSLPPDIATLGRISDSTPSNYLNGTLMEAISYDHALNDTDRQAVEAYLTAKWGI